MKKSVYIETSVISYLTSRGTRDLVSAARKQLTEEWWHYCMPLYDIYISPLVVEESSRGDSDAVARRQAVLSGLPELEIDAQAVSLAKSLMAAGALPEKASDDALHISIAAVCRIDYLLTWNCRHIDNAATKPIVRAVCAEHGFVCPEICTPEELGGDCDG